MCANMLKSGVLAMKNVALILPRYMGKQKAYSVLARGTGIKNFPFDHSVT